MATLDAELRQVALDLIEEFGKTVQFRTVLSTYDPATGLTTESDETFYDIKASPPAPKRFFLQEGDVLVHGGTYIFIAAKGLQITPYLGQVVKIGTEAFRITSVEPIFSGEQICLFGLRIEQ
jgi:hypothetical protein